MTSNENYQAPFDVDSDAVDPEVAEAQQAWIDGEFAEPDEDASLSDQQASVHYGAMDENADEPTASDPISEPFVGQWHELVSRTNWEKGRIISGWRQALIDAGEPASNYSDEAWARQVGGVTAPHVGRLRRVHDQFGDVCASYPKLSWTHFLAAMDWDDAPLWLQGASDGGWSVSGMRRHRWETTGGPPEENPETAKLAADSIDEDFVELAATAKSPADYTQPAQGGGSTKNYDDEPSNVSSGPAAEAPDFGDEESLNTFPTSTVVAPAYDDQGDAPGALVQPFAGLPSLPDDLSEAVELLKLAIVRHKAAGWSSVELETVRSYLSAFMVLIDARSR